jgi:hypothetical protein
MFNLQTWKNIALVSGTFENPRAITVKYRKQNKEAEPQMVHRNEGSYTFIQSVALLGYLQDAKAETISLISAFIDNLYDDTLDKVGIKRSLVNKRFVSLFSVYTKEIKGKRITMPRQVMGVECTRLHSMVNELVRNGYLVAGLGSNAELVEDIFEGKKVAVKMPTFDDLIKKIK